MIRWTREASADFASLHAYIAGDSPSAADRQCQLIMSSIQQLRPFSKLGRPTTLPLIRKLVVPGTKYIVFYRISSNTVILIRIMHGAKRRPASLR